MFNEGIPSQIPPEIPLDESVNHAPVRKDILSKEEKKLALANALRYFPAEQHAACLLYTSDAADDLLCVDLGGRRIIKKKNTTYLHIHP